jgi:hypothetical protein
MSVPLDMYNAIRQNRYAVLERQHRQAAWSEIEQLPADQRVPARDAKVKMYMEDRLHIVTLENQEERDHIRDLMEGREATTRAEAVRLTINLINHITTVPATANSPALTKSFPQGLTREQFSISFTISYIRRRPWFISALIVI